MPTPPDPEDSAAPVAPSRRARWRQPHRVVSALLVGALGLAGLAAVALYLFVDSTHPPAPDRF